MDPKDNENREGIRSIVSEDADPEVDKTSEKNPETQSSNSTHSNMENIETDQNQEIEKNQPDPVQDSNEETCATDPSGDSIDNPYSNIPPPQIEQEQQQEQQQEHQQQQQQQQQQMMNVNQHMQSMNLVAHYEAQMRDHLAAFTHAAAGAAWAAAQAASMSASGNPNPPMELASTSSSAAATAAAAAAAAASSAVSQLQQTSMSNMPFGHPPPDMAGTDPNLLNSMVANQSFLPTLYPPHPSHGMPMHMQAPHPSVPLGPPWLPPGQTDYHPSMQHPQYVMTPPPQINSSTTMHPSAQPQIHQHRQRNRGRYDPNSHHQNQPNKRHQTVQGKNMDGQSSSQSSSYDTNISAQMQQMQFQSPSKLIHPNNTAVDYNYNYNNNMDSAGIAATNKRPFSSSSSWQGSCLENMPMSVDTEYPYGNPHSQSFNPLNPPPPSSSYPYPNQDATTMMQTNIPNRSSRRLWSPNSKIESKRSMHKKHDYSSSPSNSDTQHSQTHTRKHKKKNRDTHHPPNNNYENNPNHTINQNSKVVPPTRSSNPNSQKNSNPNNRRRLHSSLESGNSSGGGSHSSSRNRRKSKMKKQNRSTSSHSHSQRPTNLIGKTGVMALHELCSKRHWAPPKFVENPQPSQPSKQDTNKMEVKNMNNKNRDGISNQGGLFPRASTFATNSFLMSVIVHARELGRGRGGTKTAARQDAARQALAVLIPNIAFDHNGILIYVGDVSDGYANSDSSKPNEDLTKSPPNSEDSLSLSSRRHHTNIYPCASSGMSSASEDDNTYFASRGASVCSTLLHAMWQIDHRIQEPPSYNFEVCSPPILLTSPSSTSTSPTPAGETSQKTKQKNQPRISSIHVPQHRASFACTSSITLRGLKIGIASSKEQIQILSPQELLERNLSNLTSLETHHDGKVIDEDNSDHREDKTLEATGTGATKREAKHVASAKLLALLFPACNGMVEVMAAAEAARENYAANKAITKQQKRALNQLNNNDLKTKDYLNKFSSDLSSNRDELSFILPKSGDPALPSRIIHRLQALSRTNNVIMFPSEDNRDGDSNQNDNFISVATLSISESQDEEVSKPAKKYKGDALHHSEKAALERSYNSNGHDDKNVPTIDMKASSKRQLLRQRQLEAEVDEALEKLFELDDEGRTSFGGNSIDEFGRIILRRATVYDYEAVTNLLASSSQIRKKHNDSEALSAENVDPLSQLIFSESMDENLDEYLSPNLPYLLWGGLSVILVLSRAVAGPDEPPLGCAVLTLQFSVHKGKMLKICDIAHEVHLPRERFIECLEEFCSKMNCALEFRQPLKKSQISYEKDKYTCPELSRNQLEKICREYLNDGEENLVGENINKMTDELGLVKKREGNRMKSFSRSASSLQAVEEEDSDELEDEGKKDDSTKILKKNTNDNQHNPCKRSRVS